MEQEELMKKGGKRKRLSNKSNINTLRLQVSNSSYDNIRG